MANVDHTPILVGAGQYVDRAPPTLEHSLAPVDIAAEAAHRALDHAGAVGDLRAMVDVLAVARLFEHSVRDRVLWPNPFGGPNNLPRAVAQRIGVKPRRALYSEVGGETPQRLVNQMAEAIHAGEIRAAVVTGGEALATIRKATRAGLQFDWREEVNGDFEDLWPDGEMISDYEARHGLAYPIRVYCLFEQVLRHELKLSREQYRARIGQVFAPFSAVAAGNRYAQFPEVRSAHEIATASSANFELCEPYTKWMVAQDAVNQGAAVVLTSVALARELGIPETHWVYLRAYADVDDQVILNRPRLATSHAQALALKRALDDSKLAIADIPLIDLYSCFPIAVTSACETLGIDPTGPTALTLTGGLPFFGGPGNNYSLHAIAEVVARLRHLPGAHALVAANGGYLSKHSVGIYSSALNEPWQPRSSAAERTAAKRPTEVTVVERTEGLAVIESYAADHGKGDQAGGYIVGRLQADNRRFVACMQPGSDAARALLFSADPIGTPVRVSSVEGLNYFDTVN